MRIGVFSDSHGDRDAVERLLKHNIIRADAWLFAGDGLGDMPDFPAKPLYTVRGNCDFAWQDVPLTKEIWFEDTGVLLTHGHLQQVGYGLETLAALARDRGVKLAVYGHTHVPQIDWLYGVYLINPGSLTRGRGLYKCTYGMIEVENGKISPTICQL